MVYDTSCLLVSPIQHQPVDFTHEFNFQKNGGEDKQKKDDGKQQEWCLKYSANVEKGVHVSEF